MLLSVHSLLAKHLSIHSSGAHKGHPGYLPVGSSLKLEGHLETLQQSLVGPG